MQIFAALILMTLIILLVLLLLRGRLPGRAEKAELIPKRIFSPKAAGPQKTMQLPDLLIQQLSLDAQGNATVIESFPVCIGAIPPDGYRISGPGGSGNAVLSAKTPDALSVSHPHAALGHDEQGFFLRDLGSANGTFALEGERLTRVNGSIGITENMLLRLGRQWLRFTGSETDPLIPGFRRQQPETQSYNSSPDRYSCPLGEPEGYIKRFKR